MSSGTQLSERERNTQLLAGVPEADLRALVTIVSSRQNVNGGDGFGASTGAASSLKRPSDPTANDAYGRYGVSHERRALSETGIMPPSTLPNGTRSVYDPNPDTARQGFPTAILGANTNVPYRGRASSLNGQAGTTFDEPNFQASDFYDGAMSAPQTPLSINGFVGNQMSSISFPPQDHFGFTGAVDSWLSPATPGTSPNNTAYGSSAAFSPQQTPHSPCIPASSATLDGGPDSLLSVGWRPQRRTPSTSPAPSTHAASACLQGTGGSTASSTRSSPMMGPSNPTAMPLQTGLGGLDFWDLTASQNGDSNSFLNANAAITAATESAQPIASEMQPSASSMSDLASKVDDLKKRVEYLTSENSALEGRLATLSDQHERSDKRSQATQRELTEFRGNMDIINRGIRHDIREVQASVQTMTAATHVSGQQEAPDDLTSS